LATQELLTPGPDTPEQIPVPDESGIALGAFVEQVLTVLNGTPTYLPSRLDEFSTLVGRELPLTMFFTDWATPGIREFNAARLDEVTFRGGTPVSSFDPWQDFPQQVVTQPAYALPNIVRGDFDAFIRTWARGAAAWGKPMHVRFGYQMNSNYRPWHLGISGNKATDFVAAWRHVIDIFRQEQANNVKFWWTPQLLSGRRVRRLRRPRGTQRPDLWLAIRASDLRELLQGGHPVLETTHRTELDLIRGGIGWEGRLDPSGNARSGPQEFTGRPRDHLVPREAGRGLPDQLLARVALRFP